MRYLPIVDVWDKAIGEAFRLGQLKLQKGQWIKCGANAKPSRFIKLGASGSIWAVHPSTGGKINKTQLDAAFKLW